MHLLPRRQFLRQSSLLSLTTFPAAFSALGASTNDTDGRILVVIQLSGGNDGLNTVVPYVDAGYARHRKELKLASKTLIKIDDAVGLHPSLRGMADMLEDGRLAAIQGVGYPQPNRSHAVSMAIWHSASLNPADHHSYGWLGQTMDGYPRDVAGAPHMVLMGDDDPPLAIRGRRSTSAAMADLQDLQLQRSLDLKATEVLTGDQLIDFVQATSSSAVRTASMLQSLAQSPSSSAKYPADGLSERLRSIASLIKSDFATPVYYTIHDGYDTHRAQLPTHARLLRELGSAVKAFHDDLAAAGLDERVVTLCFSEFGRRLAENGSLGTDHGTAGPVFVAGKSVQAGLIGKPPSCEDVVGGDIKMQVDFRQVYQTLVGQWLGINPPASFVEFGGLPLIV